MFNSCHNCLNNKNLTKTHPDTTIKTCGICLEEKKKKKLKNYPCNTCKKGAWLICNDCLKKCEDKCPVCRTERIEIIIEEIQEPSEINIPIKEKEDCLTNCILGFNICFHIIAYFFGAIILGSIIPFMICSSNCNSSSDWRCISTSIICGLLLVIFNIFLFNTKENIDTNKRTIVAIFSAIIITILLSFRKNNGIELNVLYLLFFFVPCCSWMCNLTINNID
jgi:hypothetical protein